MPCLSKCHSVPGPSTLPPTPHSDHRPRFDALGDQPKSTGHRDSVTSAVTRAPGTFPFMEFPPELRSRIYEFVIEDMRTTEDDPVSIVSCCSNGLPNRDEEAFRYVEDNFEGNFTFWKEYWRIEQSRTNFLYCHLNRLSRIIRQEFVPMLWSRMHVRYCLCIYDTFYGYSSPISLDLLRGNIAYIMWDMDLLCNSDIEWEDETQRTRMEFVEYLKKIDFKGTIKLVGLREHVESFRQALEGVAAAENTERAQRMALQKVKHIDESYDQLVKRHLNYPNTEDVQVKFDINLRESRYDDATT